MKLIDNTDYSYEQKTFILNIGGLDLYKVRKHVIKTIEKLTKPYLPKHHSYTFMDIDNMTVLLIKSEIQFIPDLIRALCKKNLGVYEVRLFEEKENIFE